MDPLLSKRKKGYGAALPVSHQDQMSRPLIVNPVPLPVPPNALVAVDRAIAELRRGGMVLVVADNGAAALTLSAEAASTEAIARLTRLAGHEPGMVITGRRAKVMGLVADDRDTVLLEPTSAFKATDVACLSDPLATSAGQVAPAIADETPGWAKGAVTLAKLARLLPAVLVATTDKPHDDLFRIAAADLLAYRPIAARSLKRVAEARVPLADAEEARVVAFRPSDGGIEHLAIVVGAPDRDRPVLIRLHSECFTGDLLGSLRCDCGDQLRGGIAELAKNGGGVLLYLAQEGRGIGLVNKLRAYELQDAGFDTLDANQQLGFDDDERIYLPAVEMLHLLGIGEVRLLTNNPAKVDGLARHGVRVVERVPHIFPSNGHNDFYLKTKARRSGHLF